ncbi:MAG: lipocalin family protein [Clostridia bacterium]|nr:lipocalin family protein [Clostridia bacterium]
MKRILTLVLAVMLVLLVAVACTKPEEPHTHSATKTEQVDATCTAAGVKAYWYCAGCATYFSDEACTAKIDSLDAWKTGAGKIAIKAHTATKTEQVDATATTDGVKAYWYCAGCGTYFSDEACTAVIENLDAWKTGDGKIPATGTPAVSYTLAAGTYVGTYEKNIAAMGMSVTYYYNATFNADGTFNYFVKYIMMGSVQDGVNISGTYAVEGNTVTLTPAEGAAITGTLTADNTLAIALQATAMSTTAYDVTFTAGDHVIPEIPVVPPVDPNPEAGDDDMADDEFAPAF